jgi:hypothetical protein
LRAIPESGKQEKKKVLGLLTEELLFGSSKLFVCQHA